MSPYATAPGMPPHAAAAGMAPHPAGPSAGIAPNAAANGVTPDPAASTMAPDAAPSLLHDVILLAAESGYPFVRRGLKPFLCLAHRGNTGCYCCDHYRRPLAEANEK